MATRCVYAFSGVCVCVCVCVCVRASVRWIPLLVQMRQAHEQLHRRGHRCERKRDRGEGERKRESERETQMKLKWLSLTVFFIRGLLLTAKTKRSYLATRETVRIAVGLSIHWPSLFFSHLHPLLFFPLFFIQKENLSRMTDYPFLETLSYLGVEKKSWATIPTLAIVVINNLYEDLCANL